MKKTTLFTILCVLNIESSFSEFKKSHLNESEKTPTVENPYFIINRHSPYVLLPNELGGKLIKGYAGITITLNKSGKLLSTDLKKLKLSGRVNLSYLSGYDKKDKLIGKYEKFAKECVSKIKIVKTDNRIPPDTNKLTFIIRF